MVLKWPHRLLVIGGIKNSGNLEKKFGADDSSMTELEVESFETFISNTQKSK